MKRIAETFGALLPTGRKILSVFITAGFPSRAVTVRLGAGLASAGADLLEIGIPFSDPLADGPVIQECSREALHTGTTPGEVLTMIAEIRKSTAIPIILMGYVNPILSYGMEKFLTEAKLSGTDGTIIPDLPIEESSGYRHHAGHSGMAAIFMVAPTTADPRIAEIDGISTGFVYAVTVNGVTGERDASMGPGIDFISRARKQVRRNPLLAGFGISNPATAAEISGACDGVIVGSAVMNRLRGDDPEGGACRALEFVSSIRSAMDA